MMDTVHLWLVIKVILEWRQLDRKHFIKVFLEWRHFDKKHSFFFACFNVSLSRHAFTTAFFAILASLPAFYFLTTTNKHKHTRAMKPALLFTALLGCGAIAVSAAAEVSRAWKKSLVDARARKALCVPWRGMSPLKWRFICWRR